jgi:integrase/recombinase XerD
MSRLRKAIQDYLEMRRNLGFKLHDAQIGLLKFASFLEKHNARHISIDLAMQWAQENPSASPCEWARRLRVDAKITCLQQSFVDHYVAVGN